MYHLRVRRAIENQVNLGPLDLLENRQPGNQSPTAPDVPYFERREMAQEVVSIDDVRHVETLPNAHRRAQKVKINPGCMSLPV